MGEWGSRVVLTALCAGVLVFPASALAGGGPKLTVSSQATAGAKLTATVVVTNSKGKKDKGFRGKVVITTTDPAAVVPKAHSFTRKDAGRYRFTGLELHSAGTWSVKAKAGKSGATKKVTVSPAALDNVTLTPATVSVSPPAPTGVEADFTPLGAGSPQTGQLYSVSARDRFGNPRDADAASAALSISPDGSCAASLCSPAIAGAHTVTATVGGVSATAAMDVAAVAATYSMACHTAHYNLNGNLADGCEVTLGGIAPSPFSPTIGLPAPTGVRADFTPVLIGGPQTSQAFTATGTGTGGQPIGNVTSAATWTISPDGSCAGAVCTPASSGAHTVTATIGSVSAQATLSVDPLASSYTMTCQGENYDVDGAMTNGCEVADPNPGLGTSSTALDLGTINECDENAITRTGAIITDSRTHSNPAVSGFDSNVGGPAEWYRFHFSENSMTCTTQLAATLTASGGAAMPADCYRLTFSWVYDQGTHALLGPATTAFSGTGSKAFTADLDNGGISVMNRSAQFKVKLEPICSPPRNERVNFQLSFHF